MNDTDEVREAVERAVNRLESRVRTPSTGEIDAAIRKGRSVRLRRRLGVGVVTVLAVGGVIVPVTALLPLGGSPRQSEPAAPHSATDSEAPRTETQPPAPEFGVSEGPRRGWVTYSDPTAGVSIDVPEDWSFVDYPDPTITDPQMLFGISSSPLPTGDECAWLEVLPAGEALAWIVEWYRPAVLGGSPDDFPERPDRFTLAGFGSGPHDCFGRVPSEYTIPFQMSGRSFWFSVAFGAEETDKYKDAMLDVISSLKVEASPGEAG